MDSPSGCNFDPYDCNTSLRKERDFDRQDNTLLDPQNCLTVDLRCKIFDSIAPELLLNGDVSYLRNLNVDLAVFSTDATLNFKDLIECMQYSLTSLILNLEFKFPFVFSYFGRQVTKLNYGALTNRMAKMRIAFEEDSYQGINISAIALGKLEKVILSEFNTLNVLKECDMGAHRFKLCSEYIRGLVKDETKRSVKCKAYNVAVFKTSEWD